MKVLTSASGLDMYVHICEPAHIYVHIHRHIHTSKKKLHIVKPSEGNTVHYVSYSGGGVQQVECRAEEHQERLCFTYDHLVIHTTFTWVRQW